MGGSKKSRAGKANHSLYKSTKSTRITTITPDIIPTNTVQNFQHTGCLFQSKYNNLK